LYTAISEGELPLSAMGTETGTKPESIPGRVAVRFWGAVRVMGRQG